MTMLIAGLVLFLGVHSIAVVAPAGRDRLAARLGTGTWRALHGLIALAGLVLIVFGFGAARAAPVVLYVPPGWLHLFAVLLMAPAFPMVFASFMRGRIQATLQHPLLAATKTWAFAHLLANGRLADLILFGSILAWAVAERISLKRRRPRPAKAAPAAPYNDLLAVVLGLGLYAAFLLGAHQWLFGVAPLG